MVTFLSKFIPIFIYPLGFTCLILVLVLLTKRWPRWQQIGVIITLAILLISSNHWVASGLARSLEWQYLPPDEIPKADAIVVLGGGTHPKEDPRQIVEINSAGDRVIYAGWLYHQGGAGKILVSGGRIPWLKSANSKVDTPAHEMAYLLNMLGVPDEDIWLETESQNTYENALYSRQILQEKGINRIILVTSALHMPRSVRLFSAQGFEVVPAPVDYRVTESDWGNFGGISFTQHVLRLLPTVGNLSLTTNVIKEYLGIMFYNVRGWK